MNLSEITSYKIQDLKRQLGIETTLAIHYTTYKSGSKEVIERGYIQQDAVGDLKKEIINVATGSVGITFLRLIYNEWPSKNPTIKTLKYEQRNNS